MRRRVMQVICLGVIALSVAPMTRGAKYAGGTGEPNDPYLIATTEQLRAADFNVPGLCFRLCNDIDMGGKAFEVSYRDSFRAHLDGAGFKICSPPNPTEEGLFYVIEAEASIENLVVTGVGASRFAWPDPPAASGPVGAFADENKGTIANCGVTGLVSTWRTCLVGGFVGLNRGSIVNCYFDGWVLATWEDVYPCDEDEHVYVGGLVAYNLGSIANSLTRGTVLGGRGVGGLVGWNGGSISNCYSLCPVLADVGGGGLVSENSGSLRQCYAVNQVTGAMRGGLVSMVMADEDLNWGSVSGCIWDPELTGCDRSGAGIAVFGIDTGSTDSLAFNGWADDPNWLVPNAVYEYGEPHVGWAEDPNWTNPSRLLSSIGSFYPRLAWEVTKGRTIPQPIWPLFTEGSGTENDPYVIKTAKALRELSRASIYWDKHFILANDISTSDADFSIGICPGSSFSGTFDGQGHVIRNLRYGAGDSETPLWNGGLFGYVTGEVRNLTLENCRITGGPNSWRVGLLAGGCEGVIKNCSVTGSISVGKNSEYIGALVGTCFEPENKVIDCQATVTIEAGEGSTRVGGMVGE